MSLEVMLQLGEFQFAIDSAAYQSLRRATEYRWQPQQRAGRKPVQQFMGPGQDSIELAGVIYPEFVGGLSQVSKIRTEAQKGKPLLLVDGLGFLHDEWVIKRVHEERTVFFADGTARKIRFRVELEAW